MLLRVEVCPKPPARDVRGEALLADLTTIGIRGVHAVQVRDVYWISSDARVHVIEALVDKLLVDPVVQEMRADAGADPQSVEVAYLPGVTDTKAETLTQAAALLGTTGIAVATGTRYLFDADLDKGALTSIAENLLANSVIQHFAVGSVVQPSFRHARSGPPKVETIAVRGLGDASLLAISAARRLSLDLAEMKAIAAHFITLGRDPSDVELEMLAQTWSEHCVHKTFRARIDYTERRADGSVDQDASGVVDGLLGSLIRRATETLDRPWVHSAFVDDAGIIAFDDELDIAFKVETHNHPSALEPFGGANTGVGGVIRDVIGVSARPIATTDVLCFGPGDHDVETLPTGVLHPRRIAHGVIDGIEDYGNKMGIPTVNGAVLYHPGYVANPLVYVGCLGVLPRGSHPTEPLSGDLIVVVGGRTGRDGIRGATFSSMEMDSDTGELSGSAVQIGHPIHEKLALEVIIAARDEGLYHAITDCGAGGLSSSIGEMSEGLGADVDLDKVPLKYAGLEPWEIWLSEAQERMVLAVPAEAWPRLAALAELHGIDADIVGAFRADGLLRITHQGRVVCELATAFLHDGIPRRQMVAEWRPGPQPAPIPTDVSLDALLLAKLAEPNIASKESIVRRYDHEVQGGTVVKPFVGVAGEGPSDAAVLVPLEAHLAGRGDRGVALSVGIDPVMGLADPYAMAWSVVDEAVRNLVAVGADPDRVAILDNFCWGNPQLPDRLGALVRCVRGCHDAAVAYGTPFISGKDSLNNEWRDAAGVSHPIPPTLLVSAVGIVPDVLMTVTSDFKSPGSVIYIVGETRAERIPTPNPAAIETFRALHGAIREGLVEACHDCSEGGLLVALAEMAIRAGTGFELDLPKVPTDQAIQTDHQRAFAETPSRFVVEVATHNTSAFEASLRGQVFGEIGRVSEHPRLDIRSLSETVQVPLAAARSAFLTGSF